MDFFPLRDLRANFTLRASVGGFAMTSVAISSYNHFALPHQKHLQRWCLSLPGPTTHRAAINATNREAALALARAPSSSPSSSSSSPEQRRTEKQQADFAELVQMRHLCVGLCRETLAWLGRMADDLESECAELCERAAGLPERMEKRLSAVRLCGRSI